jgi:bacillopeptidase F
LRRSWRGGTNSWFDPHGEQPTPYDALGHGTQAMGVMVGAAGTGVAPQARWIAARLFNGAGRASMSDIHLAFQWLLDPDGDPATLDAPDVVNASWALNGRSGGSCIMEFSEDIQTLRSAGIAVVFAAGNDGPMPATSNSPGNNPGVLSVGAVDIDWQLARQTSRGPSSCDGGVFPRLLAPGVNIRSTDLSHGGQASFTTVSGSSLAAPHASGVLALLAGAFPGASVAELEAALLGRSQPARLDALAAFNALRGSHQSAVSSAAPLLLTR